MHENDRASRGPLYRIGLTSGLYMRVDTQRVKIHKEEIIIDSEGLLRKVAEPSEMTVVDHAKLLRILIKRGYTSADEEFAVGPVLGEYEAPLAKRMRVVHYESLR